MAVLVALFFGADGARAQSGQTLSLFRDAEIEGIIASYAEPLFRVNGLDFDRFAIHLVADDSLNAFVANGKHLFLFSGLLRRSDDPGMVIGVIAHEVGHLAAGHLTMVRGAVEDASAMVVLSTLLGIGVGILGGGEAGIAVAAAGQQMGTRTFTRFSRIQESAADQAALRTLESTGQSAEGLRDLMRDLAESELLLSSSSEIPWFLTHPLSTERMHTINAHIERSAFSGRTFDDGEIDRHRRMIAKITGFLLDPAITYRTYPEPQASVHSRYAWAIALYRERLMTDALDLIDRLIADEPGNPWFHELKGQMLYETGEIAASVPAYAQSVKLAPEEPLLRINLARSLLQLEDAAGWRDAVRHLEEARVHEGDMPATWSLLGLAHERLGDMARSRIARAEMHYIRGELARARALAADAIGGLETGTTDWFRATDILAATD